MRYRHLIQEERYQISAFQLAGWLMRAIAAKLGRHVSTVSRELGRNRANGDYQPQVAEHAPMITLHIPTMRPFPSTKQ